MAGAADTNASSLCMLTPQTPCEYPGWKQAAAVAWLVVHAVLVGVAGVVWCRYRAQRIFVARGSAQQGIMFVGVAAMAVYPARELVGEAAFPCLANWLLSSAVVILFGVVVTTRVVAVYSRHLAQSRTVRALASTTATFAPPPPPAAPAAPVSVADGEPAVHSMVAPASATATGAAVATTTTAAAASTAAPTAVVAGGSVGVGVAKSSASRTSPMFVPPPPLRTPPSPPHPSCTTASPPSPVVLAPRSGSARGGEGTARGDAAARNEANNNSGLTTRRSAGDVFGAGSSDGLLSARGSAMSPLATPPTVSVAPGGNWCTRCGESVLLDTLHLHTARGMGVVLVVTEVVMIALFVGSLAVGPFTHTSWRAGCATGAADDAYALTVFGLYLVVSLLVTPLLRTRTDAFLLRQELVGMAVAAVALVPFVAGRALPYPQPLAFQIIPPSRVLMLLGWVHLFYAYWLTGGRTAAELAAASFRVAPATMASLSTALAVTGTATEAEAHPIAAGSGHCSVATTHDGVAAASSAFPPLDALLAATRPRLRFLAECADAGMGAGHLAHGRWARLVRYCATVAAKPPMQMTMADVRLTTAAAIALLPPNEAWLRPALQREMCTELLLFLLEAYAFRCLALRMTTMWQLPALVGQPAPAPPSTCSTAAAAAPLPPPPPFPLPPQPPPPPQRRARGGSSPLGSSSDRSSSDSEDGAIVMSGSDGEAGSKGGFALPPRTVPLPARASGATVSFDMPSAGMPAPLFIRARTGAASGVYRMNSAPPMAGSSSSSSSDAETPTPKAPAGSATRGNSSPVAAAAAPGGMGTSSARRSMPGMVPPSPIGVATSGGGGGTVGSLPTTPSPLAPAAGATLTGGTTTIALHMGSSRGLVPELVEAGTTSASGGVGGTASLRFSDVPLSASRNITASAVSMTAAGDSLPSNARSTATATGARPPVYVRASGVSGHVPRFASSSATRMYGEGGGGGWVGSGLGRVSSLDTTAEASPAATAASPFGSSPVRTTPSQLPGAVARHAAAGAARGSRASLAAAHRGAALRTFVTKVGNLADAMATQAAAINDRYLLPFSPMSINLSSRVASATRVDAAGMARRLGALRALAIALQSAPADGGEVSRLEAAAAPVLGQLSSTFGAAALEVMQLVAAGPALRLIHSPAGPAFLRDVQSALAAVA